MFEYYNEGTGSRNFHAEFCDDLTPEIGQLGVIRAILVIHPVTPAKLRRVDGQPSLLPALRNFRNDE